MNRINGPLPIDLYIIHSTTETKRHFAAFKDYTDAPSCRAPHVESVLLFIVVLQCRAPCALRAQVMGGMERCAQSRAQVRCAVVTRPAQAFSKCRKMGGVCVIVALCVEANEAAFSNHGRITAHKGSPGE